MLAITLGKSRHNSFIKDFIKLEYFLMKVIFFFSIQILNYNMYDYMHNMYNTNP